MIAISIKCVPPSITAQQKRVTFVNGKPRFFHGVKMQEQTATWTSLLQPYQPTEPMDGPLELAVRLVYPHLKSTRKNDVHRLLPKTTKPDAGNASKHLEDLLARMRFITDDARISRLIVEKFHGPESDVGIRIQISTFTA
jgi:Holliday junction resolvase RusA-like endonuclease